MFFCNDGDQDSFHITFLVVFQGTCTEMPGTRAREERRVQLHARVLQRSTMEHLLLRIYQRLFVAFHFLIPFDIL